MAIFIWILRYVDEDEDDNDNYLMYRLLNHILTRLNTVNNLNTDFILFCNKLMVDWSHLDISEDD